MINKNDAKTIIKRIFDYIDHGEEITEYDTFNGHPGLYFFHSEEEFNNILDSYLEKEEYDRYDIYYIVQRLIKFLLNKYDSHTRMWFNDNTIFPIKFKIENNKIYVINITNDLKNVIGGELVSINGIDINQILKELEKIICYSTIEYLEETTTNYLSQINILRSLPSIDNKIDKINYKIIYNNKEEELTFYKNQNYNNYKDNTPNNYTYEVKDNILIIHYNSCKDREKMNELIKQIKLETLKNNIEYYIIDIRNNRGGDSSIIDPLIDFLSDKKIVTLVNENVFSSGKMAMIDLKKIGSYIIGTNVGTSLNYFGETPCKLDLNDLGLSIKRSNRYWFYDNDLNCRGFTKEEFENYFKDKRELLEPIILTPDEYVKLSIEDVINNNDLQLNRAIDYIKEQMNINHIKL